MTIRAEGQRAVSGASEKGFSHKLFSRRRCPWDAATKPGLRAVDCDVAEEFYCNLQQGWNNPNSVVIPFDTRAYNVRADPGDTILSLSERLAKYGGGGTDCSIPLREANVKHRKRAFAGCVLVSDNESWVGTGRYGSTGVMTEWQAFRQNQKRLGVSSPKLVCIDIQPYGSTQAPERAARQGLCHFGETGQLDSGNTQPPLSPHETALGGLNIGGFSDAVFNVVASYLGDDAGRFVTEVESIEL